MSARVQLAVDGSRAVISFNRPRSLNAFTWEMYEELVQVCDDIDSRDDIRVVVVRGAGGRAFASGTDIRQFSDFATAEDGLAYEKRITHVLERVAAVRVPTIAVIEGLAVGGGLMLALACDLRLAADDSKFGLPMARTVGNCLSHESLAMLVSVIGSARALELIYSSRLISSAEALEWGLVTEQVERELVDARVGQWCEVLMGNAPLTMWTTKEGLRRLRRCDETVSEDLILRCYGSADFREGVSAFMERRTPRWSGM